MTETRTCKKCGESFPLTKEFFYMASPYKGKICFCWECRKCALKRAKQYRNSHQEQIKAYKQKYKERGNELRKKRRLESKKSTKAKEAKKRTKDDIREYKKKYQKKRIDSDPIYKLTNQARGAINDSFRHKGYKKTTKSATLTGLSSNDLTDYLLKTFNEIYGEEWDGKEKVHIDHIVPLATAKTEDDIKRLCHYSNLQLLKAKDNLKKNARLNYQFRKEDINANS